MAKKGMKRYDSEHKASDAARVPEISGKAKSGKIQAFPIIPGTLGKVYHTTPHKNPAAFTSSVTDNDLALENLAEDLNLTAADLQDLKE